MKELCCPHCYTLPQEAFSILLIMRVPLLYLRPSFAFPGLTVGFHQIELNNITTKRIGISLVLCLEPLFTLTMFDYC